MARPDELETGTDTELGEYVVFGPRHSFARRSWEGLLVLAVFAVLWVTAILTIGWGIVSLLLGIALAIAGLVFVVFDVAPAPRRLQVGKKGFRLMPDDWFVPWSQVLSVKGRKGEPVTWVSLTLAPEDDPDARDPEKPDRVRIWLPASTPDPSVVMEKRLAESREFEPKRS